MTARTEVNVGNDRFLTVKNQPFFSEEDDDDDDISVRFLEAAINTADDGPSSLDTIDLLSRLTRSRMNDQRCEMPRRTEEEAEARSLPDYRRPFSLEEKGSSKGKAKTACKRVFSAGRADKGAGGGGGSGSGGRFFFHWTDESSSQSLNSSPVRRGVS